ncbi:MAG: hypothetical protein IJL34_05035 [Treponema sp.]|nr:hypothetical protein [Treponema sp.]
MNSRKLIALAFLSLFTAGLFAGGFNDAVDEAKPRKKQKTTSSSSGSNDPCVDACAEVCVRTAAEILAAGWLLNNLTCSYTNFPYEQLRPNYVYNVQNGSLKKARFSASTAFVYLKGLGIGNETIFEGLLFPVVGPYVENIIFSDKNEKEDGQDSTELGNIRIGGQLSLLQNDYLSCTAILQWSHWYLDSTIDTNGITIGLDLRSYPVYPVAVMWRINMTTFNNDLYVVDSNLEDGVFSRRYEVFAGWKYMSVGNESTNYRSDYWNGLYSGIRIHF